MTIPTGTDSCNYCIHIAACAYKDNFRSFCDQLHKAPLHLYRDDKGSKYTVAQTGIVLMTITCKYFIADAEVMCDSTIDVEDRA